MSQSTQAKLVPFPIDLRGGVITDAEEIDIGLKYSDNLIKPPGGTPDGLRFRPGTSWFDELPTPELGSTTRIVIGEFNPDDGYPAGSFMVMLQDGTTGNGVASISAIMTLGPSSNTGPIDPGDIDPGFSY